MCKSSGYDSRNAADLQLWTFEAPDIDLGFYNNDLQPELQKSSDLADFRKTLGLVLILTRRFVAQASSRLNSFLCSMLEVLINKSA
jgi:hypothetical protein